MLERNINWLQRNHIPYSQSDEDFVDLLEFHEAAAPAEPPAPLTIIFGAANWPTLSTLALRLPYHHKLILYEPAPGLFNALFSLADFSQIPVRAAGGFFTGEPSAQPMASAVRGYTAEQVEVLFPFCDQDIGHDGLSPSLLKISVLQQLLIDTRKFYAQAQEALNAATQNAPQNEPPEAADILRHLWSGFETAAAQNRRIPVAHRELFAALDILCRVTREEMNFE